MSTSLKFERGEEDSWYLIHNEKIYNLIPEYNDEMTYIQNYTMTCEDDTNKCLVSVYYVRNDHKNASEIVKIVDEFIQQIIDVKKLTTYEEAYNWESGPCKFLHKGKYSFYYQSMSDSDKFELECFNPNLNIDGTFGDLDMTMVNNLVTYLSQNLGKFNARICQA